MAKPIIAVDLDDVLSKSAEGFVAYSNKMWATSLEPDDYHEDWARLWGTSVEESERRASQFHRSGIVGDYQCYAAAMPALTVMKENFELVIITSRREIIKSETERWLERYFPRTFREVYYAGFYDRIGTGLVHKLNLTKVDICLEIGASWLIDDQPKHCISAAGQGIRSILFGSYRWNQLDELPDNVTRASNWPEVLIELGVTT